DRKVNLFPEDLEAGAPMGLYRFQPDPATERYPLTLISPASDRTISSTLGELPRPDAKLLMNPKDADARGLADGDLVRIFNEPCSTLVSRRTQISSTYNKTKFVCLASLIVSSTFTYTSCPTCWPSLTCRPPPFSGTRLISNVSGFSALPIDWPSALVAVPAA